MRVFLKLLFVIAAVLALRWLLPQVTHSLNRASEAASTADASRGYALFAGYLLVSAALAVILAREIARCFGELVALLFVGGGRVPSITPVLWKTGRLRKLSQPRDAIAALEAHLARHPRHWQARLLIAEICRNDLKDPLLAAVEYEQALAMKLPKPKRAEVMLQLAACHLERRDTDRCAAMLRAVMEQFPKSAAAKTAAQRLADTAADVR